MPLTLRPVTRCCPPASAILAIPFVTSPRCLLYTRRVRDEIYYPPPKSREFNETVGCSSRGNNNRRGSSWHAWRPGRMWTAYASLNWFYGGTGALGDCNKRGGKIVFLMCSSNELFCSNEPFIKLSLAISIVVKSKTGFAIAKSAECRCFLMFDFCYSGWQWPSWLKKETWIRIWLIHERRDLLGNFELVKSCWSSNRPRFTFLMFCCSAIRQEQLAEMQMNP